MELYALDFEYRGTNEACYNLVCVAGSFEETETEATWLFQETQAKQWYKEYLLGIRDTHILLSFNVDAEARSLISLGLNPIKFKWIDLHQEWKMLCNQNYDMMYGKQLIQGREKFTSPKPFDEDEEDGNPHNKPDSSLVAMTFKLLKKKEDLVYKNYIRNRILRSPEFPPELREEILDYCKGDVKDLFALYYKTRKVLKGLLSKKDYAKLKDEMLWRGETVARSAVIAAIGYPANIGKARRLEQRTPDILKEVQEDINTQFPDLNLFVWNKRENRYTKKRQPLQDWITNSVYSKSWKKTKTGYSLSVDEWDKRFPTKYKYERGNLPQQLIRYEKTHKALKMFKPKSVTAKNKDTFFHFVDSNNRVHPFLNAYGGQTSRYQPKATAYLHLQPAWLRSLVEPPPGRVISSIDYGSEEFLISGLLSQDENMIEAYASGDVYLYFAMLSGAVPWDGKKDDYKDERNKFKSTVLGLSYGMTKASLALKLTQDTGKVHSPKDAQEMIDLFERSFARHYEWRDEVLEQYEEDGYIKTLDGWYMFGDNDNVRSTLNMPVQSRGSDILRKAIQLAQDAGLKVILPLHDALYIESPIDKWEEHIDILADKMKEAFVHCFKSLDKEIADKAALIRLDGDAWSPDFPEKSEYCNTKLLTGVKKQQIYIDPRCGEEYKFFKKYMS